MASSIPIPIPCSSSSDKPNLSRQTSNLTMDDLIRNITFAGESESKDAGEMTLEDFLARAGAVIEEEVRVSSDQFLQQQHLAIENPNVVSLGGGRGRRRHLIDVDDRVTLQRQKRMIKNRESAARSRERKQAYTAELESLVMQLEQENAQLQMELEQNSKERFKQLMEIPVTMKNKPPTQITRTNSG